MKIEQIQNIHSSLVNGQKKQMISQIEDYGLYDFFEDYKDYLENYPKKYKYFSDCVISYFKIKNR
jgi:hypothetical protein